LFAAFLTDLFAALFAVFLALVTPGFFLALVTPGFFLAALAARRVAFLSFLFFADFLATTKSLYTLNQIICGR
jgi:hypothetical protein